MSNRLGDGLVVPVTLPGVIAFLLLLGICYQAHELGHHFFGGLVCGRLGTVTLSTYESADGCRRLPDVLTELFGPFVSLIIAYAAALRLRSRPGLLAFGFVFASYFHLRFIPPLMGGGDELDVVRKLGFGNLHLTVAIILFLLALPPLAIAWRSLAAPGRWWTFALIYVLPLPFLWYVDALAALVSGSKAVFPALASITLLRIPVTLLVVDVVMIVGFLLLSGVILSRESAR